jgi:hypothetical protein
MTVGHLLFAAATTGWIMIAMQLEERDLSASLGSRYAAYREAVPILIPGLRKRRRPQPNPDAQRSVTALPDAEINVT